MTEPTLPARPNQSSREAAPDAKSASSADPGAKPQALEEPTTRGIDALELPPLPSPESSPSASRPAAPEKTAPERGAPEPPARKPPAPRATTAPGSVRP